MFSSTCKYAIRAVTFIAMQNCGKDRIGLKQIADELKIPNPFLGKVLQILSKNKILTSAKGPNGGFALARSPYDITLFDIVKITDGTDVFDTCVLGYRVCLNDKSKQKICPVHPKTTPLINELNKLYRQETIGSIVAKMKESNEKLNF